MFCPLKYSRMAKIDESGPFLRTFLRKLPTLTCYEFLRTQNVKPRVYILVRCTVWNTKIFFFKVPVSYSRSNVRRDRVFTVLLWYVTSDRLFAVHKEEEKNQPEKARGRIVIEPRRSHPARYCYYCYAYTTIFFWH